MQARRDNRYAPLITSGLRRSAWLLLSLSTCLVHAQEDSTVVYRPAIKPTFGLGTGMFAFYGDVGRNSAGYSPLVSRIGYELRASVPVTPWLEAGMYALHGRLGVNERSLDRNLNFDSRITIGGFQFRYNFNQFLRPTRSVEPYITLGFESVEFLTKTDLLDAQGRAYNYWSDGSIRDISEYAPNAADAVVIQRDYTYETDVRELNADGFGKYPERTWALPIGIGARMDLPGGFDFRVGTTMHYTLSDLVDGVTDQSTAERQGDGRNDRFLFTSFSVGYAIPLERKPRKVRSTPLPIEELDVIALNEDEDGDGVPDHMDDCPNTPTGAKVSTRGCPLDSDKDGVPDHLDDEPDTAPGAAVDARGRTIGDDAHLKAWLAWKDSANVLTDMATVASMEPPRRASSTPAKRIYAVKVGSQVEGISEEQIQKILSIPDVRTVVRGDTTYYVVGSYDNIPEALKREMELWGIGIAGSVLAQEGGRLIDITEEVEAERRKMIVPTTPEDMTAATTIRVQLGAFRRPLAENIFKNVPDLVTIKGDDGLMRYYTGSFTDVNEAAAHKVKMLVNGFDGAFLVAFRGGKRVSMREAGAGLTGSEDLRTVPSGSINKEMIRFRVQVGTFAGNVPIETMGTFIEVGDVEAVPGRDAVRYFHGRYTSRAAAEQARGELRSLGLNDAFVVGEVNGTIISAEEAQRLLSEP